MRIAELPAIMPLKFNDVYGNKIEKFQCPDLSRENLNFAKF